MTNLTERVSARLAQKKQLRLQIALAKRERVSAVNRGDVPARRAATSRIIELRTALNKLKTP